MKSKKTGKSSVLDQFYTNPKIAKDCIELLKKNIPQKNRKYFLEPSAGTGSFSSQLPNCVSIDLDPKINNVIQTDFMTLKKEDVFTKSERPEEICVIGNPPFGKNSSIAVKFFNHSALFGNTIAFIVPKTFRKKSLQNKLNLNYWLELDIDIPKNSFIYEDTAYNVPCCFQIWVKKSKKRSVVKLVESEFVEFVNKKDADFAVRRVGGRTGKAFLDFKDCAEVSHYFFRIKKKFEKKDIVSIINSIDFSKEANSTAGVRSISKIEFLDALNKKIDHI